MHLCKSAVLIVGLLLVVAAESAHAQAGGSTRAGDNGSAWSNSVTATEVQTGYSLYDPDIGSEILGPNDDWYTDAITLPFPVSVWGGTYTQFWINNNGNVTFTGPLSTYTSFAFPNAYGTVIVAPFFADVDTRGEGSGTVYYKSTNDRVVVTWDGVGYYDYNTDKLNTFQLVITKDGLFGFSYADMQWTTGSASGGSAGFDGSIARAGFDSGDGTNAVVFWSGNTAASLAGLAGNTFWYTNTGGIPHAGAAPAIAPIPDATTTVGSTYTGPTPVLTGTQPITWSLLSGPADMQISSTGVVTWSNASLTGSPFTITICATNVLGSATRSWSLTVLAPPVADAGAEQTVNSGDTVTLDASASHDPNGQAISYVWAQTSGQTVTLSSPSAAMPTFLAPQVSQTTDLKFSLVVSDANASSDPATVTIHVNPVTEPDQTVTDGFDYPIGNRGYDGSGQAVPLLEFADGSFSETNNLYPNGPVANPTRWGSTRSDWYNYQDVGAYNNNIDAGGIHPGEDWNRARGDSGELIYAVANGTVARIIPWTAGWVIVILHTLPDSEKYYSVYVHVTNDAGNDSGVIATHESQFSVQAGSKVVRGQVIGRIAAMSGSHLHLEIRRKVADLARTDLYPNDNGKGYYSDPPRDTQTGDMNLEQVAQAYARMQTDGIVDPSDFIDAHRPAVTVTPPPNPTYTLFVQTSSGSQASINVTDPNGRTSSSLTNFSQEYEAGSYVTITVPQALGDKHFVKWTLDGSQYSTGLTVTVQMNAAHTLVAVYETTATQPSGSKCGAAGSENLPIFGMICFLGLMLSRRFVGNRR